LKKLYPDQPVVGVGAVIIRDGKILLEKRKNDPGRQKWSIPGGLVELGEMVEQSVIREVKEETTLTVYSPQLIDVINNVIYDQDGRIKYHFVILDYFLKLEGGTPRATSDAEELRWVSLDDVEKFDLTNTFREFFVKNSARLKKLDSK
jgi:8-oxo-dGTP diphosphatase